MTSNIAEFIKHVVIEVFPISLGQLFKHSIHSDRLRKLQQLLFLPNDFSKRSEEFDNYLDRQFAFRLTLFRLVYHLIDVLFHLVPMHVDKRLLDALDFLGCGFDI